MAATTRQRPRASAARTGAGAYDAFLSYSHAADGRLAPALQAGLRSLAKPWYRLRALRVFRDKTSLSASPELWAPIERALAQARFFVLLASAGVGGLALGRPGGSLVARAQEPRDRPDRPDQRRAPLGRGWRVTSTRMRSSRRPFAGGWRASRCGSICAGRETSGTSRCAIRAFETASASLRLPCTACRRTSSSARTSASTAARCGLPGGRWGSSCYSWRWPWSAGSWR